MKANHARNASSIKRTRPKNWVTWFVYVFARGKKTTTFRPEHTEEGRIVFKSPGCASRSAMNGIKNNSVLHKSSRRERVEISLGYLHFEASLIIGHLNCRGVVSVACGGYILFWPMIFVTTTSSTGQLSQTEASCYNRFNFVACVVQYIPEIVRICDDFFIFDYTRWKSPIKSQRASSCQFYISVITAWAWCSSFMTL